MIAAERLRHRPRAMARRRCSQLQRFGVKLQQVLQGAGYVGNTLSAFDGMRPGDVANEPAS